MLIALWMGAALGVIGYLMFRLRKLQRINSDQAQAIGILTSMLGIQDLKQLKEVLELHSMMVTK